MLQKISDGAAVAYGDSDRLVVFFSSRGAYRRNKFDSEDFSRDLPYTKLFLRDESKDYFYHNGIPGLTGSMEENADFLKYFIQKIGAKRVSFVGASAGAYSALVMGHMVGVDDIHLTSLVSFLNRDLSEDPDKAQLWDGIFDNVNQLVAERGIDRKYLDSRNIVLENPGKVTAVKLHVSSNEPVDLNHAARIWDQPHVDTVFHDRGRHATVVAQVMSSGRLAEDLAAPVEALKRTPDTPSGAPVFVSQRERAPLPQA